MPTIVKYILFWMISSPFYIIALPIEEASEESAQFLPPSSFSGLTIGTLSILCIFGLLGVHYWLSRLHCPIQSDRRVDICILGKQSIHQHLSSYVLEIEQERFLVMQSPQQILCQPLHREVNWNNLDMALREETMVEKEKKPFDRKM